VRAAKLEPSLASAEGGSHFQFERQGYFFVDPVEAEAGRLVFNRTVALRDSWAKVVKGPAKAVSSSVKASAKAAPTSQPAAARAAFEPRDAAEADRYARYTGEHGLAASDAELILTGEGLPSFYEEALGAGAAPKSVGNWIVNELLRELKGKSLTDLAVDGPSVGQLVKLIDDGTISGAAGKKIFAVMLTEGGDPAALVKRLGLEQIGDASALQPLVDAVLAENAAKVEQYRAGNPKLMGFFLGQIMRRTGGSADPKLTRELLEAALGPVQA
ncbi:MAG: glutamine--tRNA ligase/YqeY domain fusion protein, partial [Planctomycetota bacterium]|jgi:glutaminyl-tRNA synthetase